MNLTIPQIDAVIKSRAASDLDRFDGAQCRFLTLDGQELLFDLLWRGALARCLCGLDEMAFECFAVGSEQGNITVISSRFFRQIE